MRKSIHIYIPLLVGGLEHDFYDFPYIGNVIIPTDELIFFRGVEATNQTQFPNFSGHDGYIGS